MLCKGTTKAGKPCRAYPSKGKSYCRFHVQEEEEEKEIWEKLGYPTPSTLLSKRYKNKLRTQLVRGPTKKDVDGWIYIYEFASDGEMYCKIGRTEKSVEKRLKEWKRDCGQQPILVDCFKVTKHKFCETLIHRYLHAWRVYRYRTKKGYCSIWAEDGEPVTKRDKKLKAKYKLEGRKKEIEWFCGDKETFRNFTAQICALRSCS